MFRKETSKLSVGQKIYLLSQKARHKIITFDIIESWKLTNRNTLRVIMHNLCKKGLFFRLKKGVYVVQPPFTKNIVIEDPFYTAQHLYNGYIGFASALYLHGLIDEIPFTVYIVTQTKSAAKRIGEYEYKSVALRGRAFGEIRKDEYVISSIPKTIYDCFYLPIFAGSYSKILQAIYRARMNKEQWNKFLDYVEKEDDKFCQRIGYMLSLLRIRVPILSKLRKHVKAAIKLDPGSGKGELNKQWKIIDNIGKKQLLSWWHYGGA